MAPALKKIMRIMRVKWNTSREFALHMQKFHTWLNPTNALVFFSSYLGQVLSLGIEIFFLTYFYGPEHWIGNVSYFKIPLDLVDKYVIIVPKMSKLASVYFFVMKTNKKWQF